MAQISSILWTGGWTDTQDGQMDKLCDKKV